MPRRPLSLGRCTIQLRHGNHYRSSATHVVLISRYLNNQFFPAQHLYPTRRQLACRNPQSTITHGKSCVYKSHSHRSGEEPFLITLQHTFNANQDSLHTHIIRRNERYPYLVVQSRTHDAQSDSVVIRISGRVILVQQLSQDTFKRRRGRDRESTFKKFIGKKAPRTHTQQHVGLLTCEDIVHHSVDDVERQIILLDSRNG